MVGNTEAYDTVTTTLCRIYKSYPLAVRSQYELIDNENKTQNNILLRT